MDGWCVIVRIVVSIGESTRMTDSGCDPCVLGWAERAEKANSCWMGWVCLRLSVLVCFPRALCQQQPLVRLVAVVGDVDP